MEGADVPGAVGLVVAAGGGSRFGSPKALARTASGEPWVARAVRCLVDGGCDGVVVVLGVAATEARALVPPNVTVVVASAWREGMGASLGVGIAALPDAEVAVITLVDLPGLPAAVVARLLDGRVSRDGLARAVYAGTPGHPVVIGSEHWAAFGRSLAGDSGGRRYLDAHGVVTVECGDLFSGADIDR